MNGLPYYKAYPRDFIEGTIGMPFEVKCAYRVVIDLIYMQGGRLPDDARYISGLLGCSIRKWKSIREELIERGKVVVSGEFLTNYRAEKELETLSKLQDKQRENRSRPNKNNDLQSPTRDHTEPEPDTDKKRDTNVSLKKDSDAQNLRIPPKGDDDAFSEFWDSVPRKVAKGQARKAWKTAVKKAPPETIIAAMKRYAKEREGKDAQFTAHPATWLNGERWADETVPTQDDFHSMISQALGETDGLQRTGQIGNRNTQRLSAPLQTTGTPGSGNGADGTEGNGRGSEQPYSHIIRPRRFTGSGF